MSASHCDSLKRAEPLDKVRVACCVDTHDRPPRFSPSGVNSRSITRAARAAVPKPPWATDQSTKAANQQNTASAKGCGAGKAFEQAGETTSMHKLLHGSGAMHQ